MLHAFDLIIVTYNSEKWIASCLDSISKSDYDLKNIHITIVDNCSTDRTRLIVNTYKGRSLFGEFHLVKKNVNVGFAEANNFGVQSTKQNFILLLNADTEVCKHTFKNLMKSVDKSPDEVALWELRQLPYEHPKIYDPLTFETSWASGAAVLIRRHAYLDVGMLDKTYFMYGEDVDLSWSLRAKGYKLQYVPDAAVYHYSFNNDSNKEKQLQYILAANIILRFKFGSVWNVAVGILLVLLLAIKKRYIRLFSTLFKGIQIGVKARRKARLFSTILLKPEFHLFDYEVHRRGAFYNHQVSTCNPLVSIIVRTTGRYALLREALISIKNQTYKNIEVVLIQDGGNKIEKDLEGFSGLNLVYLHLEQNKGRTFAANMGLEKCTGKYINFLDDDDLFFADHVETLISALCQTGARVAYALSFEWKFDAENIKTDFLSRYDEPYNPLVLRQFNYLPIQSVMFHRSVYESLGGMNEDLDYLEDWALWIKYSSEYHFHYVGKTTSIYRVPANAVNRYNRKEILTNSSTALQEYIQNIRYHSLSFKEINDGFYRIKKYKSLKYRVWKSIKNKELVLQLKHSLMHLLNLRRL